MKDRWNNSTSEDVYICYKESKPNKLQILWVKHNVNTIYKVLEALTWGIEGRNPLVTVDAQIGRGYEYKVTGW